LSLKTIIKIKEIGIKCFKTNKNQSFHQETMRSNNDENEEEEEE